LCDPRFAERDDRMHNQAALQALLEARLAAATSAEWEARLSAAGVPVGPVLGVPEIVRHPHVAARGVVQQVHVPALDRDIRVVGAGFQLAGRPVPIETPPPTLGEHTDEILCSLGCNTTELERLRGEGVI
jgi:crotonobetainyl-CoA:carnitine CoA-transferase CaiB-like acyl-CoA transferase